MTTDYYAVT